MRKVLIADDMVEHRMLLKKTLSSDYDILETQNGAEALARMEQLGSANSA